MIVPIEVYGNLVERLDRLKTEIARGEYDIPEDVRALPEEPDIPNGIPSRSVAEAGFIMKYLTKLSDIRIESYHLPSTMREILERKIARISSVYNARTKEVAA